MKIKDLIEQLSKKDPEMVAYYSWYETDDDAGECYQQHSEIQNITVESVGKFVGENYIKTGDDIIILS